MHSSRDNALEGPEKDLIPKTTRLDDLMANSEVTAEAHLKALLMRGTGEMASRMRDLDWAALPAGPVSSWPEELRSAVSICLASRHAIEIWWGPEYLRFYNDAYRPILGATKHPQFIGRPGQEMWAEIWDVVEPLLRSVRETEEAIYREDLQLFVTRNGYLEETYFSFSYGPIFRGGEVAGIFSPCTETTAYVLQRRRLSLLRKIAGLSPSDSLDKAALACINLLSESSIDVSFAALYLCGSGNEAGALVAQAGLDSASLLPNEIDSVPNGAASVFTSKYLEVLKTRDVVMLEDLPISLGPLKGGAWHEQQRTAILLPLRGAADSSIVGVLLAGVSSRLPFNEEYRVFFELLAEHMSNVLSRTSALLEERRQTKLFSSMFNSAPAFIAVLHGHEHVFKFANPPYMQLVGNRDVLGRSVADALPEVLEQGFVDQLDGVFRSGAPYRGDSIKIDLQRAEGESLQSRFVTFVYQPTKDANGQVNGIFVLGMDVSDNVAAQEALRRSEKLSAAGRLAATIAHEVNNPLEAMTNLLFLARDGVSSESAMYLTMAEDELSRIAHITKQTLAFYRESSAPICFDLGDTVESIAGFYRKQAQRAHVKLYTHLESGCAIFGVEGEIKQVLSNLIANSLDAMVGEPGSISIRTRTRAGQVCLMVSDTGSGIPDQVLSRIWEPFFTTKASVGTGLGLWVTRDLVEKHHGTLHVRTRTGGPWHGTTFLLHFPCAANSNEVTPDVVAQQQKALQNLR